MEFLWTKEIETPSFSALDGDCETDVLVIGGGMAGVLCALHLHQAGAQYLLVEAKQIGQGITKGTTAVISAQHSTLYQDVVKRLGKERAAKYLHANLQAVERYRTLAQTIPCDFEDRDSILYSLYDEKTMRQEAQVLRELGFPAEFTTELPLPIRAKGGVRFAKMAQFHPLKFLYGAAKNLNIFENTFVTDIKGTTAITPHGCIRAKKIIVCTHFPFINRRGLYFIKLSQKRSYVIALKNAAQIHCTMEEYEKDGLYFRNYQDLLLIGGGDRRTGQKDGFDLPRAFAGLHFPHAQEVFAWANQDCVTLDTLPYIGPYGSMENVFAATGFNHWGMTTSMMAAQMLTESVLGKTPALRLDTNRNVVTKQLLQNLGSTAKNLATPTVKRCPHLGCAMKWNEAEQTWDCPCHGSRFEADGTLIDNPAMRDLK